MKRAFLVMLLILAVASLVGAQSWPDFGGHWYEGSTGVWLYLVMVDTPWSIPEMTDAHWEATVVSDGATVQLCKQRLIYTGGIYEGGGCIDLVWSPSAHAYVNAAPEYMGLIDVSILVFTISNIRLIEGYAVNSDGVCKLVNSPYWEWQNMRRGSMERDVSGDER